MTTTISAARRQAEARRTWRQAVSLADLGELTARWLTGDLAIHPGYGSDDGPDPETADLVPVLAAANRAGFVTINSQPGGSGRTPDGLEWQQRACVDLLTDQAGVDAINDATLRRAIMRPIYAPSDRRRGYANPITRVIHSRDAQHPSQGIEDVTWCGHRITRADRRIAFDGCRAAWPAIRGAWYVALISLPWGPSQSLWDALTAATELARA